MLYNVSKLFATNKAESAKHLPSSGPLQPFSHYHPAELLHHAFEKHESLYPATGQELCHRCQVQGGGKSWCCEVKKLVMGLLQG